jgi:signal transduction histidine kinase
MRLSFPSGVHKTLGFRLSAWYAGIFILSSLIFALVAYLSVFSSLGDQRVAIQRQLAEYKVLVDTEGVTAIEALVARQRKPSRRSTYFIRIVNNDNRTVFLSHPRLWEQFDLAGAPSAQLDRQWHYYTSKRDGDLIEVASVRLANGSLLQVGKGITDRKEVLERFGATLLATLMPMVLIGLAGGGFLAYRALQPIRSLTRVTRSIVTTGRFDARVPDGKSGDDLSELVALFNQMLTRIQLLIAGMREALDNVAHDLRTPITRLRGVAEQTLGSDAGADTCREALADCLEETERIMAILNSLMDIAEAETGTMKLVLEDVTAAELIGDAASLYEHVADEAQLRLTADAPTNLVLRVDRARLRQALANLVDNAIKYTPSGGAVEIAAAHGEGHVLLSVRDSGVGIPADELPRIWDRLYRGDKSRSQRGLGLGLSLVKAVVQAHQGWVEVSAAPGGGSIFILHLPVAPLKRC